jgi:hypothetical protein
MFRTSLTEAAVSFTYIELVAQGAVDDIDQVGGEAGEGGADNKLLGGASKGGGVGRVGAADTAALPTWVSARWECVGGGQSGGD